MPKKKIKLDISKKTDTQILEMLNKIPNNDLIKKLEEMNRDQLIGEENNILFPHLDDVNFNNKLLNKNGTKKILDTH